MRLRSVMPTIGLAAVLLPGLSGCLSFTLPGEEASPTPEVPQEAVLVSELWNGTLTLSGTISFPEVTASARAYTLRVNYYGNAIGYEEYYFQTSSQKTLSYRIENLEPMSFTVGLIIDQDGDGSVEWDDEGNIGGWYNGTLADPIVLEDEALLISLTDTSLSGLDFGVGVIGDAL